jgi:outer membrane protein assembly factor BamB
VWCAGASLSSPSWNRSPSIGDRLYASAANGHLYSFESHPRREDQVGHTGKVRAIRAIGEPVADDRSVYFTLLDNVLYAFARGGGSERWHRALPNRPVTGPIVLDDSVIVALASGRPDRSSQGRPDRQPAAPPNLTLSPVTSSPAVATADRRRV